MYARSGLALSTPRLLLTVLLLLEVRLAGKFEIGGLEGGEGQVC